MSIKWLSHVVSSLSVSFVFHNDQSDWHIHKRGIVQVNQARRSLRTKSPTKSLQEYHVVYYQMVAPKKDIINITLFFYYDPLNYENKLISIYGLLLWRKKLRQ